MNYPWTVLGLTPDAGLRDIKRAYARLLKETRPDDAETSDFQYLHAAYKYACNIVEAREAGPVSDGPGGLNEPAIQAIDVPDLSATIDLNADIMPEPRPAPATMPLGDEPAAAPDPALDIGPLLARATAILDSDRDRFRLEAWHSLGSEPDLLNPAFRSRFGEEFLARVIAHQKSAIGRRGKYRRLYDDALSYLDQLCGWTVNYHQLRQRFSAEDLAFLSDLAQPRPSANAAVSGLRGGGDVLVVQPVRKRPRSAIEPAEGLERMFAFGIDLLLCGLIVWSITALTGRDFSPGAFFAMLILYLIAAACFEASNWQATPGKRLVGLKTVTKGLGRPDFDTTIGRTIVLAIIFGLFGLLIFVVSAKLGGRLYHYAWLLILLARLAGSMAFHDRVSGTLVINVRDLT